MITPVSLHDVRPGDLPVFFEQQLDPEAARMAAFPARGRAEFMAHWAKIMAERSERMTRANRFSRDQRTKRSARVHGEVTPPPNRIG